MKKLTLLCCSIALCTASFNASAIDPNTQKGAQHFREGFMDSVGGALKGLWGESRTTCYEFENHYSYIVTQDWFMDAGKVLQDAYNSDDPIRAEQASLRIAKWESLMDSPDGSKFAKPWVHYFSKKRGFSNSYKCHRSGDDFLDALDYTADFMGHEWKQKLTRLKATIKNNS